MNGPSPITCQRAQIPGAVCPHANLLDYCRGCAGAERNSAAAAEEPVLALLKSFCADVQSLRDSGDWTQIVTAPYCDSFGTWRAELLHNGRPRGLRWDTTQESVDLYGRAVARGAWGFE